MNVLRPQLDGIKINEDRSLPTALLQAIRKAYDYIAQLNADFNGGSTFLHIGAIPKVTAIGTTLGESALSDDGSTVSSTEPISVDTGATPYVPQIQIHATGSFGVLCEQSNWQEILFDAIPTKDFTLTGLYTASATSALRLLKYNGKFYFERATGLTIGSNFSFTIAAVLDLANGRVGFGGNASPSEPIDATGNANVSGVYKVAGTQVVGARGAAVTSPTGGGTSVSAPSGGGTFVSTPSGGGTFVSAPSGGTVIDVQARAAISSIISAISSAGNTVDPTARTAISSIITAISSAGNTVDPTARTAISSLITAVSSSGNTVDTTSRTAIDTIRARLTAHGLTS